MDQEGAPQGLSWFRSGTVLRRRKRIEASQPRRVHARVFILRWHQREHRVLRREHQQVARICANLTDLGYCVVFDRHNGKDVSYLLHKETIQFLKMKREKGVFVIDAYLHDIIAP